MNKSVVEYEYEAREHGVPRHTAYALSNYIMYGHACGGFLQAVLTNDLMNAVHRADEENLAALKDICTYLYNKVPAGCWGSLENYYDWMRDAGLSARENPI